MARKIKTLDEAPVDVIEAVKRGFIHRGFIPRKYRRNDPTSENFDPDKAFSPANAKPEKKNDNKAGGGRSESAGSGKVSDTPKSSSSSKKKNSTTDPGIAVIDSEAGSQEAAKDPKEPEPGEVHEKLIDLTEKAQDILFTADTVFPFTLFPDTITLDREKLTVVERFFFRVAKVITVPITSMISADANVGPFFGSVHMTSKYFIDNTHVVNFLWRHDAEEFHRLLQGFIIAQEKGLDVSGVEKEDLKVLLRDLGHGTNE
jgi:hypothetical protein